MTNQMDKYREILENNDIENIETLSSNGDFKLKDWEDGTGGYEKVQGKVYGESVLMYVEATKFTGFFDETPEEPYSPIYYLKGLNINGKDITYPLDESLSNKPDKIKQYYQLLMSLGKVKIVDRKEKEIIKNGLK